jgi:hypothetical protein
MRFNVFAAMLLQEPDLLWQQVEMPLARLANAVVT